jgi:hypothetical protein
VRITLEFEMDHPHDVAVMACVVRLVEFQGRDSIILVDREHGNNRLQLDHVAVGKLARVTLG